MNFLLIELMPTLFREFQRPPMIGPNPTGFRLNEILFMLPESHVKLNQLYINQKQIIETLYPIIIDLHTNSLTPYSTVVRLHSSNLSFPKWAFRLPSLLFDLKIFAFRSTSVFCCLVIHWKNARVIFIRRTETVLVDSLGSSE